MIKIKTATIFLTFISLNFSLLPVNAYAEGVDYLTELSLEELMQVQVTSVNKRPEKLTQSASAIQVILNEQIHRSSATNIPETLRLASNLNVAQQNSHEWIVSARGFSSDVGNKLLVLMDGRSVYTPLFSGVFWERQDYVLDDLERIEVISGPGATIWGANAVNGVINIVSKNAKDTQGWHTKVAGGTRLKSLASVRYGGSFNSDSYYRVYVKGADRDTAYLSDGSEASDEWNNEQAGFRTDIAQSSTDKITVQGDYYSTKDMLSFGEEAETKGGNLLFRWKKELSSESDLHLQIYYDYTDLQLPVDAFIINGTQLSAAGTFKNALDTYDIDFDHQFNIGDMQRFIWGIEYRQNKDHSVNTDGFGFDPEEVTDELYSIFFQDEIALIEDELIFTLGTKIERNDYTGQELEPSARLSYRINEKNTAWSAISKAVRIPSRIDTGISQPNPPNFVLLQGNKDFKSEKLTAYEIGYRFQAHDNFLASLAVFYNEYDEIRSTNLSEVTIFPLYFKNDLEGETYGVEIDLNWQASDWLLLKAGYNNLQENLNVKDGGYDFNNTHNETADPKNQFYLRSSIDIGNNIDIDINFRYVDELPTNDEGNLTYVPDYKEIDMKVAWLVNDKLELSLVGQNLLHKSHQEFGIPENTQEEIGRNVFINLTWNTN